jgi:3-phenylpropionate/trans-cinnamate dioxygenase ferredoxin reductase subunit
MSETIVIVGAGHCAGQLAARLRAEGFEGSVVVIGDEPHVPYQRPPLSKQFIAGEVDLDRVYLRPADFYESSDVGLRLGTRVTAIDRAGQTVSLDDGETIGYDKLVLATGARARELTVPGANLEGVTYLRDLGHAHGIRERIKPGARLAVVGGGYIGLELAAVAAGAGVSVTVLEMEPRLLSRVVAEPISDHYLGLHGAAGVDVRTGVRVVGFEGSDRIERVMLEGGETLEADFVVIGIGVVPNEELAAEAGLAVDNGIIVDEFGRTEDSNIYAAGDCTSHPSALYSRRVRLESVHNAMAQAKVVAANLCGNTTAYDEVPWFWSDQYDVKLQIAGLSQGHDETVLRGDPEEGAFTVFYLKDGVVIAADTVNGMRDHMACRALVTKRARIPANVLSDPESVLKDLA